MKEQGKMEKEILSSWATRKLVYQVLELCETKDIVDAMSDLETVLLILEERFQGSL